MLTFQDINHLDFSVVDVAGMRNDNALSKCSQMFSSRGDELSTLKTETMITEEGARAGGRGGVGGPTRVFYALIHLFAVSLAAWFVLVFCCHN